MMTAVPSMDWIDDAPQVDAAAEEIIRLLNCTTDDSGILGFPEQLSDQAARDFIADLGGDVERGSAHLLVGRQGAALLGMMILRQGGSPNTRHIGELTKGVIAPSRRGSPILARALAVIVERAVQLGIEVLTLDVRSGTPAHRLWEKCGFRVYGTLPDYARYRGKVFPGSYLWQRTEELAARLKDRNWSH